MGEVKKPKLFIMASMDSSDLPPNAYFFPAQDHPVKLEFVDKNDCSRQFMATHDLGYPTFENRHYIDEHLWRQLKEDNPQLGVLVRPHPPAQCLWTSICQLVTMYPTFPYELKAGQGPGLTIRGMLEILLPLRFAETKKEVKLKNVLVVKGLPVPFHISTNAPGVNDYFPNLIYPNMPKQWLNSPKECNTSKVFNRFIMAKECFPSRYHDHPYWDPELQILKTTIDVDMENQQTGKWEANLQAAMEEEVANRYEISYETENESETDVQNGGGAVKVKISISGNKNQDHTDVLLKIAGTLLKKIEQELTEKWEEDKRKYAEAMADALKRNGVPINLPHLCAETDPPPPKTAKTLEGSEKVADCFEGEPMAYAVNKIMDALLKKIQQELTEKGDKLFQDQIEYAEALADALNRKGFHIRVETDHPRAKTAKTGEGSEKVADSYEGEAAVDALSQRKGGARDKDPGGGDQESLLERLPGALRKALLEDMDSVEGRKALLEDMNSVEAKSSNYRIVKGPKGARMKRV